MSWALRLLAVGFVVAGIVFIADPDGTLTRIDDGSGVLGGSYADAPATGNRLWLGLAFAYMMVIAAVAWLASTDLVRYRALILVLVLAKVASSLAGLGFFLFTADAWAYLVNFIVDGSIAVLVLWCWVLAGRVPGQPARARRITG